MPIGKIHHVQLAAPPGSEEEARTFFVGVLGLQEVPKPDALAGRGGAWFRNNAIEIHVGIEREFQPARKAHVALQVDDLADFRQQLDAHGVETWEHEPLPGYARFYAHDPFGNRLEFLTPLS